MKTHLWLWQDAKCFCQTERWQWHWQLDPTLLYFICRVLIYKLQLDWFEKSPSICRSPAPKPVQDNAISALGGSQILFQGICDNGCPFSGMWDGSSSLQQWPMREGQFSWAGIELLQLTLCSFGSLAVTLSVRNISSNGALQAGLCKYCPRFDDWQLTQR